MVRVALFPDLVDGVHIVFSGLRNPKTPLLVSNKVALTEGVSCDWAELEAT